MSLRSWLMFESLERGRLICWCSVVSELDSIQLFLLNEQKIKKMWPSKKEENEIFA